MHAIKNKGNTWRHKGYAMQSVFPNFVFIFQDNFLQNLDATLPWKTQEIAQKHKGTAMEIRFFAFPNLTK